jgi:hypothetical protein
VGGGGVKVRRGRSERFREGTHSPDHHVVLRVSDETVNHVVIEGRQRGNPPQFEPKRH